MQADLARIRRDEFAGLSQSIYLNAASSGALPRRCIEAAEAFQRLRAQPHRLDPGVFSEILGRARAGAAALIGADADEISLGPNTTFGLNFAADVLGNAWSERRVVLVSEGEFPANVYPWLWLERRGYRVERLPTDADGCPDEAALLERVGIGDVALLAISFVQFATGYRADLAALGEACRRTDTLFVVDGIQGVGVVPLDVRACHIDVLACGAQKWLCSPFGTGFMYVRRELRDHIEPPTPGWLSFRSSQEFESLLDYELDLLDDGRRFEVATLGIQDYAGCAESLALIGEIGVDRIWRQLSALLAPLRALASGDGRWSLVGSREATKQSGILALRCADVASAHARLRAAGVVCVVRENAIRFAPHFYNTTDEMDRVMNVLEGGTDR